MSPAWAALPARALDGALEATVAGSFTAIGYRARRRAFDWQDPQPGELSERTALVTGATSGLGFATATALARLGARTVLLGRDPDRTEQAAQRVRAATGSDAVETVIADLADLTAVSAAAADLLQRLDGLDILVNNAGALTHEHTITGDGLELTYQTHVVAPFLLTHRLLPLLQARPDGRVITVSSGGMYTQALRLPELRLGAEQYDGVVAYAQAKRAQVVLNEQWSRRATDSAAFHAMHPGWADTPGVVDSLPTFHRIVGPFLRTPQQGADTIVWLAAAAAPVASSGLFWLDRRPRTTTRLPRTGTDGATADRLWDMVAADAGVG